MSGGPTVDLSGDVVGVNSFNIAGETEAFNFITPSSLVTEMLARNGVEAKIGPTDEAYRAGLTAYFSGDYQTAVHRFTEVLALSPTHQQALEFKVLRKWRTHLVDRQQPPSRVFFELICPSLYVGS